MKGEAAANELQYLALDFERRARPRRGRYVPQAAVVEGDGFVVAPPAVPTRTIGGAPRPAWLASSPERGCFAGITEALLRRASLSRCRATTERRPSAPG